MSPEIIIALCSLAGTLSGSLLEARLMNDRPEMVHRSTKTAISAQDLLSSKMGGGWMFVIIVSQKD